MLSTSPNFVTKVRDVVSPHVSQPKHTIILCVDEKSQIQAPDRSQPMLPMRLGQLHRRSYDYSRRGTTQLLAGLEIVTRGVIGKCNGRHRAAEFRKFVDEIEATVQRELDVQIVMDNYVTHKTPLIQRWFGQKTALARAPDPDRFFMAQPSRALLTEAACIAVSPHSGPTISSFIDQHDARPKLFRWAKSADDILASMNASPDTMPQQKASPMVRTPGSGHYSGILKRKAAQVRGLTSTRRMLASQRERTAVSTRDRCSLLNLPEARG